MFDVAAVSSDESFVVRENKRDDDGDGDAKTRFFFFFYAFPSQTPTFTSCFFSLFYVDVPNPPDTRGLMPSPWIPHYSSTARARRAPRKLMHPPRWESASAEARLANLFGSARL